MSIVFFAFIVNYLLICACRKKIFAKEKKHRKKTSKKQSATAKILHFST